ncbi:18678_t:CDS:2 [Acaulospora morrowiae]|uniref:18678_t:CDS:1 n=1 Tax=Acaulospora morrowiae TaxID=94023 RepID=A0A9N9FA05_9GLOM|nr:18678_t:CDS:2 [Acaulospora morrowiae]
MVYGLNLTSKNSSAQPPKLKRALIFDEADDQDSNGITDEQYKEALEEVPTAFAYDEVYDDMKSAERKRLEIKGKDKGCNKKPKYVDSLLKAAEIRQRDYIRAQKRKYYLIVNRYKAQQEKLRKAEEEERLRDQTSSSKTAAIEASRSKKSKSAAIEDDSTDQQPKTDRELADQAKQEQLVKWYC